MDTLHHPSNTFLETSTLQFIRYSTAIMQSVILNRLLKVCSGDENRAYDMLINYMHSAVANHSDSANLYRNFLSHFNGTSFAALIDQLDLLLSCKILLDQSSLGLLYTPTEYEAVQALRSVRNHMLFSGATPDLRQKLHKDWLGARTALKGAVLTFPCYLNPYTILQIDQYNCGLEPLSRHIESSSLLVAAAQLPEQERLAILLRYFNGLSQEQTAQILQLPREQVSCLERKGLRFIRKYSCSE